VLQFKPGILLGPDMVDEVLDRAGAAIGLALADVGPSKLGLASSLREHRGEVAA
jgi:hypothetical protein